MVVISILWMTDVSLKKKAKRLSFFHMDSEYIIMSALYLHCSGGMGTRNQPKNGFKAKLNKAFLHFMPNIFADDFSTIHSNFSTLHFKKSSSMAKFGKK